MPANAMAIAATANLATAALVSEATESYIPRILAWSGAALCVGGALVWSLHRSHRAGWFIGALAYLGGIFVILGAAFTASFFTSSEALRHTLIGSAFHTAEVGIVTALFMSFPVRVLLMLLVGPFIAILGVNPWACGVVGWRYLHGCCVLSTIFFVWVFI